MKRKRKDLKLTKRLLPSDFTKVYKAVDDGDKQIIEQQTSTMFNFPKDMLGNQDVGEREFLVFYFDDPDDYKLVRQCFEKASKARSHPVLDEKKLVTMVQARKKRRRN